MLDTGRTIGQNVGAVGNCAVVVCIGGIAPELVYHCKLV